ncbi:hypothetical protein ACELLULO517_00970 [Acidisoma cellulosilytica]|uniref:Uncharacterized protein n=1 Tax=Acidisoma cellulosilyticum TaxID=2802395 RepID=A0A963YX68_9PROT|nr:hypothetical protein [Acidisoma cellulosilyticum]MCB8878788.1 hypothetical protein [Acidisoma cellulosilyticum]
MALAKKALLLVWTLAICALFGFIVKRRLGYEPTLDPLPVWALSAFFFLFVLWSVPVLVFSVVWGFLKALHEHLNR